MQLSRWRGAALSMTLAALVICGAAFCAVYMQSRPAESRKLEIRNVVSGKIHGRWPLRESEEFAVEFIHSVNQSAVRESFTSEGKMIRPISVRFFSFGAGMQSDLEEGQALSRDGDAMIITGYKTSFRELGYIVGTVSDHLLIIGGETVSLTELCGKNAHIVIRITGGND